MDKTGFNTLSSSMEFADNYVNWILHIFKPYIGSKLLEVGTGRANFRRHFIALEHYVSIDIDETVVERAEIKDPKGLYIKVDVAGDKFKEAFGGRYFDTIICVNVLEHIEDEQKAISNMLAVLEHGGFLLILVPALTTLYSDLDRLAGHIRRYTLKGLSAAFKNFDCELIKLEFFNPIGGIGWWANKLFRYSDLEDSKVKRQIHLFDKYILPVSRVINPVTKNFFGQSIICVVKKS